MLVNVNRECEACRNGLLGLLLRDVLLPKEGHHCLAQILGRDVAIRISKRLKFLVELPVHNQQMGAATSGTYCSEAPSKMSAYSR